MDLFKNNWKDFVTGPNKGIWREKKYFMGGVCGVSLKWSKDQDQEQGDCDEKDIIRLSGMKVKVCPQFYTKDNWQRVFDLTKKISNKISWNDDTNHKDFFGCGLIAYTQKLNSPYMFLNPDFLMSISCCM